LFFEGGEVKLVLSGWFGSKVAVESDKGAEKFGFGGIAFIGDYMVNLVREF
jgi:hypothetical protein